ncbi:MAG: hypothetical protein ACTHLE_09215 [Agriterribacter sp.]
MTKAYPKFELFCRKVNAPTQLRLCCCVIWLMLSAYACSTPSGKNPDQNTVPANKDSLPISTIDSSAAESAVKDDIITPQHNHSPNKRTLTPADVQYLDLVIIEEHPEIILFHEDAPETIAFANELKNYFKSRHADMRSNGVPTPEAEKGRSQKFYIHHVGDNLFRVYVFNEWGESDKW